MARGQVVAVVIWQASIPVAIGTLAGVPIGIATGRFLWARFASKLYVVPQPAISMVTVAAVATSTLALAILTAIVPGWRAARTPVAKVLRASEADVSVRTQSVLAQGTVDAPPAAKP